MAESPPSPRVLSTVTLLRSGLGYYYQEVVKHRPYLSTFGGVLISEVSVCSRQDSSLFLSGTCNNYSCVLLGTCSDH